MTNVDYRTTLVPAFNLNEMNRLGQQQADALKAMQTELSALFEETKQAYTDRIEVEQQLTAELVSSLSKVKSFADGATAYQNWISKHFQLWTEDGKRMADQTQKLCAATSRVMTGQNVVTPAHDAPGGAQPVMSKAQKNRQAT